MKLTINELRYVGNTKVLLSIAKFLIWNSLDLFKPFKN